MLGAQITGRLLPEQNENPLIYDFIKKCDEMAGSVNSLVPVFHCMHTPGNLTYMVKKGKKFKSFKVVH